MLSLLKVVKIHQLKFLSKLFWHSCHLINMYSLQCTNIHAYISTCRHVPYVYMYVYLSLQQNYHHFFVVNRRYYTDLNYAFVRHPYFLITTHKYTYTHTYIYRCLLVILIFSADKVLHVSTFMSAFAGLKILTCWKICSVHVCVCVREWLCVCGMRALLN